MLDEQRSRIARLRRVTLREGLAVAGGHAKKSSDHAELTPTVRRRSTPSAKRPLTLTKRFARERLTTLLIARARRGAQTTRRLPERYGNCQTENQRGEA